MTVSDQDMAVAVDRARGAARIAAARSGALYMIDELESAAVASVARSTELFDDTRGVPFPIYAGRRAYGAALDEIRGWQGRDHRKFEAAPADSEAWMHDFRESTAESSDGDPAETVVHKDRLERVLAVMDRMSPLERDTLVLVGFRGLTLSEAGRKLGFTESYICHILKRVRARLRLLVDDANS